MKINILSLLKNAEATQASRSTSYECRLLRSQEEDGQKKRSGRKEDGERKRCLGGGVF